ncbi:MAG: hypothetical protein R3B95_07835 [Nitrospirales bacterium]|nr:hypothetical protein [Nitrospirales bacterium]
MASITDLHAECLVYDQYLLTKRGSLIGGLVVEGRDGDGLTPDDFQGLSLLARSVYQDLPASVIVTQYYAHFAGMPIQLKARAHPIAHMLSDAAGGLSQSADAFIQCSVFLLRTPSRLRPCRRSRRGRVLAHCAKSLYSDGVTGRAESGALQSKKSWCAMWRNLSGNGRSCSDTTRDRGGEMGEHVRPLASCL